METLFTADRDPNRVNKMQMDEFIQAIVEISVNNSITVDQALKAAEILELRRKNNLALVDGEIKDGVVAYLKPHIEAFAAKMETFLTLENNG